MTNIESFHDIPTPDHQGRATAWMLIFGGCVLFWSAITLIAVLVI